MRMCEEVLWELKHDGHEYKELACDFPDIPMEASDFVPVFFHDAMLAYTRPRRNGFVYVELGHLVSDNLSVLPVWCRDDWELMLMLMISAFLGRTCDELMNAYAHAVADN
jgi:hypothetical protein